MLNPITDKLTTAATKLDNSTLVALFGNVSARLAEDPTNRNLVIEHRIYGDELLARLEG